MKGVPKDILKKEIVEGKSISLCFPKYKIYSSAIVGGILPISVGMALSLKRKKSKNKVYCFMGDMTSETGIAHETIKYSMSKNFLFILSLKIILNRFVPTREKLGRLKKLTYEKKK